MIDVKRAAEWLSKLVAFDTRNGTGDEVACADFLRRALEAHAPDKTTFETVARSRGKSDSAYVLAEWGQPKVLLNVHIDTVPSGDGWTQDSLALREEGDRLIGLGSSDIKGAAACILAAMESQAPKDVAVLFSGDEEHGSEVMQAVIERGHYSQAPLAIVCEPTNCELGRRHRGMLAFSADFSGKGGHSSLSDVTAAPMLEAAKLAAAIGEYGAEHRDFGNDPYKGLCVNIGDIVGDGAYNVIPTHAKLWVSLRPPPGDSVEGREADIRNIAKDIVPGTELDKIVGMQPFATKDMTAFTPIFGEGHPQVDLPYWTEAALLGQAGVNAVVYGPGDVDQAHKPNEFVTKTHLAEAAKVYARAMSGEWL